MQNREVLIKWKNKFLNTGKRNNQINFRNTKSGYVDVTYPDVFLNLEIRLYTRI